MAPMVAPLPAADRTAEQQVGEQADAAAAQGEFASLLLRLFDLYLRPFRCACDDAGLLCGSGGCRQRGVVEPVPQVPGDSILY